MKKTLTAKCAKAAALAVFAAFAATAHALTVHAAKVEEVKVRQLWPWSTDIKVEYTLSGVTAPVDISITAYDGERQLDTAALVAATTGDRFAIPNNGVHTLTIDPVKAFGKSQIALADFKVRIDVAESSESMTEVLYKVIRLSDGNCRDLTRADFFNGKVDGGYETDYSKIYSTYSTSLSDVLIWTGVTNNPAYKSTHIVMRHIKCKGAQWTMGGDRTQADAPECQVVLTNNFWISVFPITVGQHKALGASGRSSYGLYPAETNLCPATGWRENIRDKTTHSWSTKRHSVASSSWLGTMRSKTGYDFELPTEAQWEFAARAGVYQKELYTGEADMPRASTQLRDAVGRIAWFNENALPKVNGVYTWHPVGSLRPNAFGIYDMLGGGAEYMLNTFYAYDTENTAYEPEGGDSTAKAVFRSFSQSSGYAANSRVCVRVYESDLSSNGQRICRVILPDFPGLVYPAWDKK